MTSKEILEKYKQVAVYGMSTNSAKPANYVPVFIHSQGYNVVAINPNTNQIGIIKSYSSIADVEEKIEILNVFRRSEFCLDVVKEAVERKKIKGDIDIIWLQEGIINDEAKQLAEENGIVFIQDRCMLKEYNKYY